MFAMYRVEWLEFERGWGHKHSHYTFHKTKALAEKEISDYWDTMPDDVSDWYLKPMTPVLIEVTEQEYKEYK